MRCQKVYMSLSGQISSQFVQQMSIAFFLQSRPHNFYHVTMQYLLPFLNRIGIGIGIVQEWSEPESESNRAHVWESESYRNRPRHGQGISIGIGTENPGIADS